MKETPHEETRMITTTHATLKMLRAGRLEVVTIPVMDPKPGARASTCPVAPDREYLLMARATDDHRREKLRALALDVVRQGDSWLVTFRAGVGVEQVRYLSARPGSSGDYTTVEGRAAKDEPEPVDEVQLKRFEKDARTAEQVRLDWERVATVRDIEAAIGRLEERGDEADRTALQKLRSARRELLKAA